MKNMMVCILAFVLALCGSVMVFADCDEETADCPDKVVVNGNEIDAGALPCPSYSEGNTLMIPLRAVAEALGYKVGWNSETGAITVDDEYIQSATLYDGSTKAIFSGRLSVIDMSREIENAQKTTVIDGHTYVPSEFFKEFLNDVITDGKTLKVSPSMAHID